MPISWAISSSNIKDNAGQITTTIHLYQKFGRCQHSKGLKFKVEISYNGEWIFLWWQTARNHPEMQFETPIEGKSKWTKLEVKKKSNIFKFSNKERNNNDPNYITKKTCRRKTDIRVSSKFTCWMMIWDDFFVSFLYVVCFFGANTMKMKKKKKKKESEVWHR